MFIWHCLWWEADSGPKKRNFQDCNAIQPRVESIVEGPAGVLDGEGDRI
jgi:hypothetical protein